MFDIHSITSHSNTYRVYYKAAIQLGQNIYLILENMGHNVIWEMQAINVVAELMQ